MPPEGISEALGGAFGEVAESMEQAGVGLAGPPFTRYFSFGPAIEAEAGFPVMRPAPDIGRVHPGQLPGGRVASIVHIGPYDTLEATYGVLMARLGELGHVPTGPMWEIYWSDPDAEPDPATWRTEILVPDRLSVEPRDGRRRAPAPGADRGRPARPGARCRPPPRRPGRAAARSRA